MDINLLKPYINYMETDDGEVKLLWCHETFVQAAEYYKLTCYNSISFDQIIESVSVGFLPEIHLAVLYGALKAANSALTPEKYEKMHINHVYAYVAILEGISNYLPLSRQAEIEAYNEVKQKRIEVDWAYWFGLLKQLNFSTDDIYQMTFRGMVELLCGDEPEEDDLSWLIGPDPGGN